MGKVKIRSGENKYYSFKVSIPYGKGKGVRLAATNACQDRVSIPYGKGKVIPMTPASSTTHRLCINSLWER